MRSLAQVERDITEVSLVLEHSDVLTPSYDNDGNVALTVDQRVAALVSRLSGLMTERSRLLYILDIPAKTD
jgi:hypothetical protein